MKATRKIGIAALVIGLVPLVAGAVLLAVHSTKRDGDGYYASGSNAVSTPTRALVSDRIDVGDDGPDWLFRKGRLGTIRVSAGSRSDKPIFVGIARESQVQSYLRGVAYDEVTDFDLDPFTLETARHDGAGAPSTPAARGVWDRAASGRGRQTIEWPVRHGDWAVVVMNADGSAGVAGDVSVGAKLGFILWLGVGLLVAGAVVAASGLALVVRGRRR